MMAFMRHPLPGHYTGMHRPTRDAQSLASPPSSNCRRSRGRY